MKVEIGESLVSSYLNHLLIVMLMSTKKLDKVFVKKRVTVSLSNKFRNK